MFRKELQSKFERIFGMKSTFDQPSIGPTGTFEQETIFIQVDEPNFRTGQGIATAKVTGSFAVFAQMDKMPFGYFNRRIEKADPSLTKDLFFYDIDLNPASSPARIQNITERRVRFVYLYQAQYDPDQGEITSLEI